METGGDFLKDTDSFPIFPVTDIEALAAEIDTAGFAVLPNVVPLSVLGASRRYIERELQDRDGQYFGLAGHEWVSASPLQGLVHSAAFCQLLSALWLLGKPETGTAPRLVASLRVLAGTSGQRHSFLFHYDSYVVTALIPLLIPEGPDGLRGDLILYPSLRQVRRSAIINICEKALVENSLVRRIWRCQAVQRCLGARVIRMQPGNIYLFWGMRSLHGNQACSPDTVRSTALFHFGDPHGDSFLKRLSARHHQAKLRRLERR